MTIKQKIPQPFIDDLLAKADIIELIGERVSLKKSGSNWYGQCPFHQEKTPSFSVSQPKQFYYCFGCKASGNIIQFLMDYHHYSFPETVELLANHYGFTIPVELQHDHNAANASDHTLLADIALRYHQELLKNPKALAYLKQRQLSLETIKAFQIGYVPDQWRFVLGQFGKSASARAQLEKLGMIITKNDNQYDRFRHRIMFPIHNIKEQIIGFGGRVIDHSTPKYLNSPETPIYHKSEELYGLNYCRRQPGKIEKILVVEGYMDVIGLANRGIAYATATLGTAISSAHLKKLLRQCQHLIFCFDGDQAGHAAAWKALTTALPHAHDGSHMVFCFLPEGEDPDSMVNQYGKEAFEQLLSQGKTLSEYFFDHLSRQGNAKSLDQKAALAKSAAQHINTMPPGIFKTLLLKQLSETIQLPAETITQYHYTETVTKPSSKPGNRIKVNTKTSTNTKPSPLRQAITLLLQYPAIAKTNQASDLGLEDFSDQGTNPGVTCLITLWQCLQNHPNIQNTGMLLQHLQTSTWYKQLCALASNDTLIEKEAATQTFFDLIAQFNSQQRNQSIQALIAKAAEGKLTQVEKKQLQKMIKQQKSKK